MRFVIELCRLSENLPMSLTTSEQCGPLPDHIYAASVLAACLAIGLPMLLAYNLPPSSTFLNQAAALVGWGALLVVLAGAIRSGVALRSNGLFALQGAFALLLIAALASPFRADFPWSLSLSSAALIAAAALTARTGASVSGSGLALPAFRAFCIGMVVAGFLSSLVGLIQVFAPTWADGDFVSRSYIEGRAVGNMRQPNHLSSLLLWSIVAAVWLGEARVLRRWGSTLLALLFVFVVVLTASRTGAVSMGLLMLWGALDRRLSRHARVLLVLTPILYGLFWYATGVWADATHHVFGGETRFSIKGDVSSSRLGIWSNTLSLIRMHPWAGVGFGEFNFAWTLTPFPGRPVAFFDHTHNLILQLLVGTRHPARLARARLAGVRARDGAARCAGTRTTRRRAWPGAAAAGGIRDGVADPRPQPARVPALVRVLPVASGLRLRTLPCRTRCASPHRSARIDAQAAPAGRRLARADDGRARLATRLQPRRRDLRAATDIAGAVGRTHRRWSAQRLLRAPCRLRRGHDVESPGRRDALVPARAALPARCAPSAGVGHGAQRRRRHANTPATSRSAFASSRTSSRPTSSRLAMCHRRTARPCRSSAWSRRANFATKTFASAALQVAATQSPDLPPCFSSTRISPITMPRSAALHMS